MIDNKDLELCVRLLEEKETLTPEEVLTHDKFKLIIDANNVKKDSEEKLYKIQDELRKLYEKDEK